MDILSISDNTTAPAAAPGSATSTLHAALNAEWARTWAAQQVPAPDGWANDRHLRSFRWVGDVLPALESPGTAGEADDIVAALANRAVDGDVAAGRVAVQHLISWAQRAVRRMNWRGRRREDVLDELLSTLWEAVTAGGVSPGEPKVRLRLLRRAEYYAFKRPARQTAREVLCAPMGDPTCREHFPVADLDGREVGAPRPAAEEVAELLAEGVRRGLSRNDAALLGSLYLVGLPPEEVGRAIGLCPRTLRYRSARARQRLAALVAVA